MQRLHELVKLSRIRENLKSGRLGGVYAFVRGGKRRLLRQPLAGALPVTFPPMSVEELFRCLPRMRDHSRFQYSLGLAYRDRGLPGDELKAAACLRSAEALGFESPERVAIRRADLENRRGAVREVARLIAGIEPAELTPNERSLLERMQTGLSPRAHRLSADDGPGERGIILSERTGVVSSLLVVGDADAATATWWPEARYLCATPEVTGLAPDLAVSMGLTFEMVVGPYKALEAARQAGVRCIRWQPTDAGVAEAAQGAGD